MILYINSCMRNGSRTDKIARALLKKLGDYTELVLEKENIAPLNEKTLEYRNSLIERGNFSDDIFSYAKQFASADTIVISAPYWDMSFPAVLKSYIENICVMGIASSYDEDGRPHGLCRAKELYYVTTSGGPLCESFGYGQIEALSKGYFGIQNVKLIKAELLDIVGNDADKIVQDTINKL